MSGARYPAFKVGDIIKTEQRDKTVSPYVRVVETDGVDVKTAKIEGTRQQRRARQRREAKER